MEGALGLQLFLQALEAEGVEAWQHAGVLVVFITLLTHYISHAIHWVIYTDDHNQFDPHK